MFNHLIMNDMKKILIFLTLVLTGVTAMAQTSVWHGGRAVWTRGAGTESDPYLLESADHLAYLAYIVNKGFDTDGLYFRLTTDIDLNGSEDLQWVPIGMGSKLYSEDGCDRGKPGSIYNAVFRGHFDGGEHSISNIYIDNGLGWYSSVYGDYTGLFGTVEGKRESGEVVPAVIENLFLVSGTIKGNACGGIVGNGSKTTLVSHCWNGAAIEGRSDYDIYAGAGGIVGMNPYQVKNCYNKGDISGCNAGGIVGISGTTGMVPCEIMECYNEGAVSGVYAGGIIGASAMPQKNSHVIIDKCYNTGDISADGSGIGGMIDIGPAACGIAGYLYSTCGAVTNCYHAGTVSSTKDSDCVLLYSPANDTLILQNNFYINTCGEGQGEAFTEEYMRSQEFVDFLNSLGTGQTWALDTYNLNNGFPVLAENLRTVEVVASPSEGGTVTGSGTYQYGSIVTVSVVPNLDYQLDHWTKNGVEVSEELSFDFVLTEDCQLVAYLDNKGVNETNASALKVYPNPAHGQFTVEGQGVLIVSDLLGQVLRTYTLDGQRTMELPQGLYFLTLGNVTRKLVVE